MYTYNDIRNTDKNLEPWWTEIVLRPFVYKMVYIFANYTRLTPNHITILSFMIGMISAYYFLKGTSLYLIIGALLFELSYIIDRIDGRIARLKRQQSKFGAYLDFELDISKYFLIILCMIYGQYILTNDITYFIYGFIFIFFEFVAITHVYTIGDVRFQKVSDTLNILNGKVPFIIRFKQYIDPKNRLAFSPSAVEAETVSIFIAPILNKIKLGMIIGSIILVTYILSSIIFYFFMKRV